MPFLEMYVLEQLICEYQCNAFGYLSFVFQAPFVYSLSGMIYIALLKVMSPYFRFLREKVGNRTYSYTNYSPCLAKVIL